MAAEKGKTPGKTQRRTTGKGPQSRNKASVDKAGSAKNADVSNRSRSRAETKAAVAGDVELARALAKERVTHITCHQSMFQLRAERVNVENGRDIPVSDWTLDFGTRGFIAADEATVEAVEKVLAGEWSDGRVNGIVFQRNARKAGLSIVVHGLANPPITTWDKLSADRVVRVAFEAGALDTPEKVAQAIRYENESPERTPAREPRQVVLDELAQVEAVVAAGGGAVAQEASAVTRAASGIVTPQAAI